MQDIEHCRTAVLGGQVYFCEPCQAERYSYHSCKNRHCPKCGNDQANEWLDQQQNLLLPIPYFLLTFTSSYSVHARRVTRCGNGRVSAGFRNNTTAR